MKELLEYFEKTLRAMVCEEIRLALETYQKMEPAPEREPPRLLSSKAAADYCGISTLTLYRSR